MPMISCCRARGRAGAPERLNGLSASRAAAAEDLPGDRFRLRHAVHGVRERARVAVGEGKRCIADRRRSDARWVERHGVDRKSTRLNSSHPSISYAVFCLKKKKQKKSRVNK